jgi:phosphoesterase RecJ-like protein
MDLTNYIKDKDTFLITTHIAPDGDAICTELAVAYLLESLGKKVFIVNDNVVPDHYKFLKGTQAIISFDDYKQKDFDAVVIVDCPNLERIGRVKNLLKDHYVINIDHHISNEAFADISFVDPDASSAAEVVYFMFKNMKVPLNETVAKGTVSFVVASITVPLTIVFWPIDKLAIKIYTAIEHNLIRLILWLLLLLLFY